MNSQRVKSSKGRKRQKKTKQKELNLPAPSQSQEEDEALGQNDKIFLTGINIATENKGQEERSHMVDNKENAL